MAATFTLAGSTPLPNGNVLINGYATLSNAYATGGETLDLSAYIKAAATSATFTCVPGGDDGVIIQHNRGTAAAGKLLAYEPDNGGQCASDCDLSAVICPIIAIGPAY